MRRNVYTNRLLDCIPIKCIYIITSLKDFSNNNVLRTGSKIFHIICFNSIKQGNKLIQPRGCLNNYQEGNESKGKARKGPGTRVRKVRGPAVESNQES